LPHEYLSTWKIGLLRTVHISGRRTSQPVRRGFTAMVVETDQPDCFAYDQLRW
jgi:hypothetical protein